MIRHAFQNRPVAERSGGVIRPTAFRALATRRMLSAHTHCGTRSTSIDDGYPLHDYGNMPKRKPQPRRTTVQAGLRVPPDLLEQVDYFARILAERTGLPVGRTQAMIWLLRRALEVEGAKR